MLPIRWDQMLLSGKMRMVVQFSIRVATFLKTNVTAERMVLSRIVPKQ